MRRRSDSPKANLRQAQQRDLKTIAPLSHRPIVLTDTSDYRTIGFLHYRPNPRCYSSYEFKRVPNGVPAITKQRLVDGLQRAVKSRGRILPSTTASLLSIFVIVLVLVRENNNALNLVKLSLIVNGVLFSFFEIFSQRVQRALMSLSFFFFLLPFILPCTELRMSTALKIWNDYKKLLIFVPFVF